MRTTMLKHRRVLDCLSLVAFLAALGACELGKSWREPALLYTTELPDGPDRVGTSRGLCSADGCLFFTTDKSRSSADLAGRAPARRWSWAPYGVGAANSGRALDFPQNLWSSDRPSAPSGCARE